MILTAFGSLIRNVFLEDLMKSPREQEIMVLALEFGYLPGEVMASHRTDFLTFSHQPKNGGDFGGWFFWPKLFWRFFFFPNSMLWGTSGLVGWLVPEPGFWVAKVRTVSEVAGRFGALGIWKDGQLRRFGSIGSFRRIARFQGIPRLRMDLFGLAKAGGGAGRPHNSYLSGWKKLVASSTKWILFELVGFWRQATDAPYSCKTATTNIWAEYLSEKGGWGCN